jgi:lysophospholipase L1-like esterase
MCISFTLLSVAKCQIKNEIQVAEADTNYLASVVKELKKEWPDNRTINLVFHGHSVPSGYQQTPKISTFGSYPLIVLKLLTEKYPFAVINTIKTSIGGENAEQGAERFKKDVLSKQADVVFIDYALNDRHIGLKRAAIAWEQMIKEGLDAHIKLILLTPTPDLSEDSQSSLSLLAKHTYQIIQLGKKFNIPVINSYEAFNKLALAGVDLKQYMAQSNHINTKGHQIVANLIASLFDIKP